MAGTKDGAKKFTEKKLAEDPNYFKKLSARATNRGGILSPGSFKPGNKHGAKGGTISKRGKAKLAKYAKDGKPFAPKGSVIDIVDLQYEEMQDEGKIKR